MRKYFLLLCLTMSMVLCALEELLGKSYEGAENMPEFCGNCSGSGECADCGGTGCR